MSKLILASASPRRRELMELLRLPFEVQVSNIDESKISAETPEKLVQNLALNKARAVASAIEEGLVVGADTIVVSGTQILGKPSNSEDAAKMLQELSNREHRVLTGVALVDKVSGYEETNVETTHVKFKELSYKEIEAYIATGEPFDKAGAYGIQGFASIFIEGIHGDYFNVVGLPVFRLAQMLKAYGQEII